MNDIIPSLYENECSLSNYDVSDDFEKRNETVTFDMGLSNEEINNQKLKYYISELEEMIDKYKDENEKLKKKCLELETIIEIINNK